MKQIFRKKTEAVVVPTGLAHIFETGTHSAHLHGFSTVHVRLPAPNVKVGNTAMNLGTVAD